VAKGTKLEVWPFLKRFFLHFFLPLFLREVQVLRRYHITNRDDYVKYNRIVGKIKKLTNKLKSLAADEQYRIKVKFYRATLTLFEFLFSFFRDSLIVFLSDL